MPRRSFLLGVSALLVAGLGSQLRAQTKPATAPDNYARAHLFLRAAYPELSGRRLALTIAGADSRSYDLVWPLMNVVLVVSEWPGRGSSQPLLTASFEFRANDVLWDFYAEGEVVNEAKEAVLRRLAQEKPFASAAEVAERLASQQVRYGADQSGPMRQEVRRQLDHLQSVLGRLELLDLWLTDDGLHWRADVRASTRIGPLRYAMLFEPFEGRLASFDGFDDLRKRRGRGHE